MAVPKQPSRFVELDLEATAELPLIDFDEGHAAELLGAPEAAIATDIFPAPGVPAGMVELADSLRDVESRLQRKIEKAGQLETELAAAQRVSVELRTTLDESQQVNAAREAALRAELAAAAQREADLQREISGLQTSLGEARDQLQKQRAALDESQAEARQRTTAHTHQERDLAELRRRAQQQHEALGTWQGFRAVAEGMLAESEAQLHGFQGRHQAALQEAQSQCSFLQDELAAAQARAATQITALEQSLRAAEQAQATSAEALRDSAASRAGIEAELAASREAAALLQRQLDTMQATDEKARLGAARFDEQQAQIAALQAELAATAGRLNATEVRLQQAGERVQRLESDAHAGAALLGSLQQNMERLGRDDTGVRPALQPAGELALRVLIRHDDGPEMVYPLSRRTSIGRTADNDIQVDTTFVSRHHAVLLSNTDHCIVEDLNSTNGVLVNGRRVGRQILHDGDTVTVGRTEFRYQQRS